MLQPAMMQGGGAWLCLNLIYYALLLPIEGLIPFEWRHVGEDLGWVQGRWVEELWEEEIGETVIGM